MFRPLAALALCLPWPALAQDASASPQADPPQHAGLQIELNAAQDVEAACRLTFLVRNGLGVPLGQLALETVVLTDQGIVDRLTLFDFRDLPMDLPRVRQFDLPGIACASIATILINGVATCAGPDSDAVAVAGPDAGPDPCAAGLSLTSRVAEMEIIG